MRLQLIPLGPLQAGLMAGLADGLRAYLGAECDLEPPQPEPQFAFHSERQQYHSTEILNSLKPLRAANSDALLGVTAVDIYIPILTFVFGEAELGRGHALLSIHRLRQQFYGLPEDAGLLAERLAKEAVHELGHAFGLRHCGQRECVMSASHAVEWVDIKSPEMCADCHAQFAATLPAAR